VDLQVFLVYGYCSLRPYRKRRRNTLLLKDRVAIISGVGPGMGRDIALIFAREGARLVLGARTQSVLDKVADEVRELGAEVEAVPTDITSDADCQRIVQTALDRFGRVDILANNAYREGKMAPVDQLEIQDWRDPIEVNLFGTLRLTMEVVKVMKKQGNGSIVMTNSQVIRDVLPTMVNYAASKGALFTATQGLARELGQYQIRVNSVMPGYIWGDTLEGYFKFLAKQRAVDPQVIYDEVAKDIALGKIPHSSEIAEAVLFFASDLSRVITGQSLDVNGGHVFV
jgi:NAD(P)-dependent dehydrogenase (short-subunit alcohol dehydrogenase family)